VFEVRHAGLGFCSEGSVEPGTKSRHQFRLGVIPNLPKPDTLTLEIRDGQRPVLFAKGDVCSLNVDLKRRIKAGGFTVGGVI
jgi:hypothetical protein